MPLAPGSRLSPYEIISQLGSGGMGDVYKAKDLKLERIVAVKVLPKELADNPERRVGIASGLDVTVMVTHAAGCRRRDPRHRPSLRAAGRSHSRGRRISEILMSSSSMSKAGSAGN